MTPAVLRACFAEAGDHDFIRWTSNLLRTFLEEGSLAIVGRRERPDLMLASIWRRHRRPAGLPVILVSNENWRLFPPHFPLREYAAVLGLYPPGQDCTFIEFPYAAVHFDLPPARLYALRTQLLEVEKTHFCCFVASNTLGELAARRVALFHEIGRLRAVDSGGSVYNNLGYQPPRGAAFLHWLARYRYMICLENSCEPGYMTEKPWQPWFAGTVPIYDGGALARLNLPAIVAASRGDVVAELERLEASPQAYEEKRRSELMIPRLSLGPFEAQFRSVVLGHPPVRPPRPGWLQRLATVLR